MNTPKFLLFPALFAVVLVPVMGIALLTYRPGDQDCNSAAAQIPPHTHGAGIARTRIDDMQLVFNVSPGATLFQVVDGRLELCTTPGGDPAAADLKHVTLDVYDAALALGERLPVEVTITLRDATTGQTVVEAAAPAMIAAGHGYHYGDNFRVPNGATYEWEVRVTPPQVNRLAGAADFWREPVTWSGTFSVDEDGSVREKAGTPLPIGEFTREGLHVVLRHAAPQTLYAPDGSEITPEPGSRYVIVDITDHVVSYEEKLPGALVTLAFRQGDQAIRAAADPAIGPEFGFHYGANVILPPGAWTVEVTIGGLDFLRHAGAAVGLARGSLTETLTFTLE